MGVKTRCVLEGICSHHGEYLWPGSLMPVTGQLTILLALGSHGGLGDGCHSAQWKLLSAFPITLVCPEGRSQVLFPHISRPERHVGFGFPAHLSRHTAQSCPGVDSKEAASLLVLPELSLGETENKYCRGAFLTLGRVSEADSSPDGQQEE